MVRLARSKPARLLSPQIDQDPEELAALLDTNVAIYLRNDERTVSFRIAELIKPPKMSIVTRVELDGGIYAKPQFTTKRLAAVDILLRSIDVLDLDQRSAEAYRAIVAQSGFSRRRVADRTIVATALVHDLTLVTMNGADFNDIAGLKLEVWDAA